MALSQYLMSFLRRLVPFRAKPESAPSNPLIYFYPIQEGNVIKNRYSLVRVIGDDTGTRSTIWLSKDTVTGNDVVLKITGADSTDDGKYSQRESDFLAHISETNGSHPGYRHVVHMRDRFSLSSDHGIHSCMVLDLLGQSVAALRASYKPERLPIPVCKQIIKQTLLGLDYLHSCCGIVHTDLKLDNLLLNSDDAHRLLPEKNDGPSIGKVSGALGPSAVVICDFGVASWANDPFDGIVQPYALRAPEIYLRIPWGSAIDIWSMGCLSFELVSNRWLFIPSASERWSRDDDHLAQMIEVVGGAPMPSDVLARGAHTSKYFDQSGNLLRISKLNPSSLQKMVTLKSHMQPEDDPESFVDLISRMLRLRPEDREPAAKLVEHPWLQASVQ